MPNPGFFTGDVSLQHRTPQLGNTHRCQIYIIIQEAWKLLTSLPWPSPRFMQSDPWWSLAMAVNVYMVFFLAANPNSFRRYLWLYCLVCFGAPALPALICLILRRDSRGIYGNATVSCFRRFRLGSFLPLTKMPPESCGAGLMIIGVPFGYSPTICQYGCASYSLE